MKNLVILVLVALLFWFGHEVVRLENIRYASDLGICPEFQPERPSSIEERLDCLSTVQTRTSFMWHILYGIRVL